MRPNTEQEDGNHRVYEALPSYTLHEGRHWAARWLPCVRELGTAHVEHSSHSVTICGGKLRLEDVNWIMQGHHGNFNHTSSLEVQSIFNFGALYQTASKANKYLSEYKEN